MKKTECRVIMAAVFVLTIFLTLFLSNPAKLFTGFFWALKNTIVCESEGESFSVVKNDLIADNKLSHMMIEVSSFFQKITGNKAMYNRDNIYLDNNYIVSVSSYVTTDYEYNQLCALEKETLKCNVPVLYVNAPTKYFEDSYLTEKFGVKSYSNQNADVLISRLEDSRISVLDLREAADDDHMNVRDMFYKSDHHWTVESGLWASRKIADKLNHECGLNIDLSLLDRDRYEAYTVKKCWLGEQGQKVGAFNSSYDDFSFIHPRGSSAFVVESSEETYTGSFEDVFFDLRSFQRELQGYRYSSFHYFYRNFADNDISIINQDINNGNILLISDSYSRVLTPFIANCVNRITTIDLRTVNGATLSSLIGDKYKEYDCIVVCYAPYMIGAHEDVNSYNYPTFNFCDDEE